jgi:hypothetical protein
MVVESFLGIYNIWSIVSGVIVNKISQVGEAMALCWQIIGLASEDKFRERISLGKHVKGKIGLPESNFIALVEKNFFQP